MSHDQESPRVSHRAKRILPVTGHRFFLLFLFLLADLVFYPYAASGAGIRYYIVRVLGAVVVLLAVYAISFRRGVILIALLLAVPALLQHALFRDDPSALPIINAFLSFAFDVFVMVVIARRIFVREKPNAETIFGALCIYLMVGFVFARLYAIISTLQPHAFYLDPLTNQHAVPKGFDFIYYSFGTMSSLGAAGMMAVSPQVRSLSVIEAILGVLYLAVLIARLMGAYRTS
jgi:hypothetical protein